ncbi:hypothetical protein [Actinomadura sp. WMMA1423]|uniref:hypothetical protein n=1 Tax=Actinomadura sp. WMMA1423 TaxID=2591108 RepID=UPI0011479DB8|nr:hypothetical protein [Actinomadura sp. WMMA1423]
MAGPYTRSHRAPALACAALTACTALAACGDGSSTTAPSPAPSTSSSPVNGTPGSEKLVLRWRKTGGVAGLGGPGSLPDLSLYASGRAVAPAQGVPTEYRLRPEALRRLLGDARAAGLARSHTVGSDDGVADAFTITVTMDGATTRIVRPEAQAGPEGRFLKRLDPATWPASDLAGKPGPYKPERTAVLAGPPAGGAVKTWPLEPLGKGVEVGGAVCTEAPAGKVPAMSPDTAWRSGGQTYSVRLRPLLPDESACRDVR